MTSSALPVGASVSPACELQLVGPPSAIKLAADDLVFTLYSTLLNQPQDYLYSALLYSTLLYSISLYLYSYYLPSINMYTYTATSKFLVLAPTESGPATATQGRERSSSQSSSSSEQQRPGLSRLPSGFLYLGVDTRNTTPSL
ncbi:uncharacterized protein BO80DRAFT_461156 [Aspergillus ibericus CBS 121593]|uniref:Uncharacterized protein n=1 Tax=Aspergillus ibericus CBS 121593 TaxID=1448316 RepID=A0A395HCA1_9EURO|nr:hypothetical protein BO80DRAFT_461156 [Aspergillus ibericus CBS 121593]RAL05266.1 hypothetical protein BO80DRAFT_461156 [Aspergillus ibericus CBS 121593]